MVEYRARGSTSTARRPVTFDGEGLMWVSTLERKLLREAMNLKGQIATIAIVLAGGITCFISMRGTVSSLESSRDNYYDRYRFAHVFAHAERAPETVARR